MLLSLGQLEHLVEATHEIPNNHGRIARLDDNDIDD